MAEANYGEAFLYDDDDFDEKELVQELLKSGIYGEQTNLDGILEAAQKNRDATIDRVKKLNIFFASEQNEGKKEHETLLLISLTILALSDSHLLRVKWILRCYATVFLIYSHARSSFA